jgi:hypothetical protein
VFNKIKPTVNWLLGTEKRTRFDYKILPREESDETAAEVKTKLFKYIERREQPALRAQRRRSRKWCPPGLGWLEEGINTEPGRGNDLRRRRELAQRAARQPGAKTGPEGRPVPVPLALARLDIACEAMFPNRANILRSASMDADEISEKDEDIWYLGRAHQQRPRGHQPLQPAPLRGDERDDHGFSSRRRVKIIEAQHRVPTRCQVMRGDGVA